MVNLWFKFDFMHCCNYTLQKGIFKKSFQNQMGDKMIRQ